jgi:thiosulfate reductase/polysulfide reductase chain A
MSGKKANVGKSADISRRGFLELCAGAGTGAALGMHAYTANASSIPHTAEAWSEGQVLNSICGMCVNRCGIRCRVENGVLQKIDGEPRNPKSRGRTCAKGQAGIMAAYDPNRIKYPMIRAGKRGEGKWRRASWDEANAYVAENLTKIIDKYGPEALLWSSTTDLTETFFVKLGSYIGTPNFARHATLCLASRNVGYFATMGGVPDSDLAHSKYMLMFGANRAESFEPPDNMDMIEGIENGGKLVVVDPRMTVTASKGQWIPIRPRTDMALVFGIMNVLIKEELYDKQFVAERTVGFEQLKAHIAGFTPEYVARETDIPAATIVTMAREMAAAAPAVTVFPGRRSSWYTNDTQFRRAASMLTGLLGAFDAPGASYFNAGNQRLGSFDWELGPMEEGERADGFNENFPLANHEDGGYVSLRDAIVDGTAKYPVKGWMIYHQNPLVSVLDESKTRKMMEQMDFICTIDIQPSQTAWMSDIILPETTYLERLDPVCSRPGTRKYIAIRQPVIEPIGESRTLLDIIKGLAPELDKRHEFETPIADAFNFTMDDYIDAQLAGTPIDRNTLLQEGIWVEEEKPLQFGDYRSGKKTFNTPSGKIEFVSERFARNGYDPLPVYESPIEEVGKQRLITGHMAQFTHAANQNNSWLNALYPENELWIHPTVATSKGIHNGDYVKVKSEAGETRIKAKVTRRIRSDVVFMVHGFGSQSGGQSLAHQKGGADQVLMKSAADAITNNQAMHETFVDVVPA